jgi:DNA sulfur modification protein DndD
MKINKVRIYNFGPFYNEHIIEFPKSDKRIDIIRGNNGQGKTTIQRAILWALYGTIKDRKNKEVSPTSLINRNAINDCIYHFWVQISYEHDNDNYILSRKMSATAHQDSKYLRGMEVTLEKNSKKIKNIPQEISRIIPQDISRFFVFDGEMLRDYEELLDQTSPSMKMFKQSIEKILGIPYLTYARDDLIQVQRSFERDKERYIRKLGGQNYEQIADNYEMVINKIEETESKIENFDKNIYEYEILITDEKRNLADLSEIKELAQERINIEKELNFLNSKLIDKKENIKNLSANIYKTILFEHSKKILDNLDIKHQLTLNKFKIKQSKLQNLIDLDQSIKQKLCVLCENKLNNDVIIKLKYKQKELDDEVKSLTEIEEPNLEFERYKSVISNLENQKIDRTKFIAIEKEIIELTHNIATLKSRLNIIREKLLNVNEDEPFQIENKIRNLERDLGRIEGERDNIKKFLAELYKSKSELDFKLSNINQHEFEMLQNKITITENIVKIFDLAISRFREKRKKK